MKRCLIVVVVFLSLITFPAVLLAQDADGDGISNANETSNTTFLNFSCMSGTNCSNVPGCYYASYGGHNYLFCTQTGMQKNWSQARNLCQSYGGDLLVLNSAAEESFISGNSHFAAAWLGYTDQVLEGTFVWVHGASSSYTHWNGGEPNNTGDEDCATYPAPGWNDVPCGNTTYYAICEDGFGTNPVAADTDADSSPDALDNCPNTYNPTQADREFLNTGFGDNILTETLGGYVWGGGLSADLVTSPVHDGTYAFRSDNNDNFAGANLGTVASHPTISFWLYLPNGTSDLMFQMFCTTDTWNHRWGFSGDGAWNGQPFTPVAGYSYNLPTAQWIKVKIKPADLGCLSTDTISGLAFSTNPGVIAYFDSVVLSHVPVHGDACDYTNDFDGDGIADLNEANSVTSPAIADTDVDGLSDSYELSYPPTSFTCMADNSCPAIPGCTYQTYGGHNYLFCTQSGMETTWPLARNFCQGYGGDLIEVNNSAEESWVMTNPNFGHNAFMGLSDLASEGRFASAHGDPVIFADWYHGEPNDFGGNDDCAGWWPSHPSNAGWADMVCGAGYLFICEDGFGLNPVAADTDGDGLCDRNVAAGGCVAGEDLDGDGVLDPGETNPNSWDTDGDGTDDLGDCDPRNPAHWADCGLCIDNDADDFGQFCDLGPDCDDTVASGAGCHDTCGTYYEDADVDLFGNPAVSVSSCMPVSSWVINGTDCSDANTYAWSTCATCVDNDLDGDYLLCDRYHDILAGGTTTEFDAGWASSSAPLDTLFNLERSQMVYLASEVGQAGYLRGIAINVTDSQAGVMTNFTIRMKHTDVSNFGNPGYWEGPATGWTTVYQNDEPPVPTGWHVFYFTTPFYFNGTQNLMIDFSINLPGTFTSGGVWSSPVAEYRLVAGYDNGAAGDPINWTGAWPSTSVYPNGMQFLPDMRFHFALTIGGPDCDDDPVTGPSCHAGCTDLYPDGDGDGFGAGLSANVCPAAPNFAPLNTDCEPAQPLVYPGQASPENPGTCDLVDNQCPGETGDGVIDEGCDVDSDGLDHPTEISLGTDPNDTDTDDDGLTDFVEANGVTDPIDPDSDDDGLNDGEEINTHGTDPNIADTDADGLDDSDEISVGTSPLDPDSDNDGMNDGFEVGGAGCGLDPLAGDSTGNPDGDAYANLYEFQHDGDPCGIQACSDSADTDGDGLIDLADPGCAGLADDSERGGNNECDNGMDDDFDGYSDYPADPDCYGINDKEMKIRIDFKSIMSANSSYRIFAQPGRAYFSDSNWPDVFVGIYDVANPASPALLGTTNNPMSVIREIHAVDNRLYVGDSGSLRVIDVANPASPALMGSITPASGDIRSIVVSGDHAYLANSESGLVVVNVTNPAGMAVTGTWDSPGNAYGVAVVGQYAYLADAAVGLQVIDIGNPAAPTLVGSVDTPGWAAAVSVVGNYAYVADGAFGLQVIDISNPASPVIVGSYNTPGVAMRITVMGGYAFVADGSSGGLQILNVANPANPVFITSIGLGGMNPEDVSVADGNYLYVPNSWGNPVIFSINDRDEDGISDWYELDHSCMNVNADDAADDSDSDSINNHDEFFARLNPCSDDTDNDGNSDVFELVNSCLDPRVVDNPDVDGDGILNVDEEYTTGTNVCVADTDGDDLVDGLEINSGSDPFNTDTDSDGLTDGQEALIYGTSPIDTDMDDDGLSDYQEVITYHTDPWLIDTDGDGLSDFSEVIIISGNNPVDNDSDDNGIPDNLEPNSTLTDGDTDLMPDAWEKRFACVNPAADDSAADPDSDSLGNLAEYNAGTDPCDNDTDGDGLTDSAEISVSFTDPKNPDTDGDGLNDGAETVTDPLLADTDGDGWNDGVETNWGFDPTDPVSSPNSRFNHLVNYQGRLADSAGLPVSGSVPMSFAIFDAPTGGAPLWGESQSVTVTAGIYNVLLGSVTPLTTDVFGESPALFLQVTVNGQTLAPRTMLTSVPTAMFAERLYEGRLEMESVTLTVAPAAPSVTAHVSFRRAYSQPPRVVVSPLAATIGGIKFIPTLVSNVTATGFDVTFDSLSGKAATGSAGFTYQAMGN